MSHLVIDASAALSWIMQSQATQRSMAFLAGMDQFAIVAPTVFPWEVGNVLARRARRDGRFDLERTLEGLAAFEIEIDPASTPSRFGR